MNTPLAHHVMEPEDVVQLLARISAFDARTVGQSEVQAWTLIAQRGRWTLAEATEQVIRYFSTEQGEQWLMPGRLNTMIRMARQDALDRRPVAPLDPASDGAHAEGVRRDHSAIMALWAAAQREAKLACEVRRALVLRYSDLAEQLKSNLIGYSRAENWSGWIPPATVPGPVPGAHYVPNDSPRRAKLLELVEEAERRAEAEGGEHGGGR